MRFYRTILRDDRQLLMCCASDFVSATTKLLHAAQHGAAKMLPLYFLELIKSTHKNLVSTLWSSLFAKTAPAAAGVPASSYEDCIGAEQTQKTENSGLERYEVLRQIVPALPARSSELSAAVSLQCILLSELPRSFEPPCCSLPTKECLICAGNSFRIAGCLSICITVMIKVLVLICCTT